MSVTRISALVIALGVSLSAHAHEYRTGNLRIGHPAARATVPGQPSGVVYLSIENSGKEADKLIAISSPNAKSGQIHTMSMEGTVMKMREVDDIELPPNGKIAMQAGDGYHLMLIGLKQPLKLGDKFPLTLTFQKAGKLEVSVHVEETKPAKSAAESDSAAHMHK